jgi:hypothetical protein
MSAGVKAQTTNYDFSTTINGGTYFITLIGDNGTLIGSLGNATYSGVDPTQSGSPLYGPITTTSGIYHGGTWGTYSGSGSGAVLTGIHIGNYNSANTQMEVSDYLGNLPTLVATYITGGNGSNWVQSPYTFTVSGGAAPEMNASFIPQVALMLACLFFLLGRKKEVVEPFLAI